MLKPAAPPYDISEWRQKPFAERVRLVCQAWAIQGYGTPLLVYTVYLLKIALYIWVWSLFVSATPGLGGLSSLSAWAFEPIAFQKAVLWTVAFEGLGLGCGSGPLTGRYVPPVGGALYFLRPGTTKVSFFPGLPVIGGQRRTLLDVALYAAHYVFLLRALLAPELSVELVLPTVVLLPLLGLTDKTLFLVARADHYFAVLVCFLFAGDWLAGTKLVWVAIWMWAATSKLNRHFPSVICVMTSNSPVTSAFPWVRKRIYRDYPNDLRPGKLAHLMAHVGTVVEYSFPLVLVFSSGGVVTDVALVTMLLFHLFITSNIPMGVPIEWNVIMVYGGFFLFGQFADVSAFGLGSPVLAVFLALALIGVPVLGNLVPSRVSFLCSMRYYAGNWAYSVWLFRGDSTKKLDEHLVKASPQVADQLRKLYDEDTTSAVLSKVIAFRCMHLHGRALHDLIPRAVDDIDEYEWLDGELVAGVVVGWNFGEGHLHDQQLLEAVQAQCGFEEGELRCIFVESQPLGVPVLSWTIADAKTGVLERGRTPVDDLVERQPWPKASSV